MTEGEEGRSPLCVYGSDRPLSRIIFPWLGVSGQRSSLPYACQRKDAQRHGQELRNQIK